MVYRTRDREGERTDFGKGRFYYWNNEDPRISVTNAIKNGLPAPALINWAKKFVATYVEEHWDELPEMRDRYYADADEGFGVGADEFVKFLSSRPYAYRDKAGDIGNAVHDWAEAYIYDGAPPEPDVSDLPPEAQQTAKQFIDFLETVEPKFYAVETVVHNRRFGYAGTLDAIMDIDSGTYTGRFLVDYKTSKGVYESAALQVAALAHADFMAIDGQEVPMPDLDGGMVLHLRPNGWKLVPVDISQQTFAAFRSVLETALWVTGDGKKNAVGRPVLKGAV